LENTSWIKIDLKEDLQMSVLETLTEGIKERSLQNEGAALLAKWDRTGLLEGLSSDFKKNNMARLLENQAAQLLKEVSSMAGGDVQGFASVAFPIVRRVFGGLIANDLVSVQPMSLPSGLIFFMDFTYNDTRLGADANNAAFERTSSLYGGGKVGSQITEGVELNGVYAERGFYALNNGYASPTGSAILGNGGTHLQGTASAGNAVIDRLTKYDPDLSGSGVVIVSYSGSTVGDMEQLNVNNLISFNLTGALGSGGRVIRRLTQISTGSSQMQDPGLATFGLTVVYQAPTVAATSDVAVDVADHAGLGFGFTINDKFSPGDAVGSVMGASQWALENQAEIPEINIKVDSVAVTAITKKLKAKWTPELGQDLNAYHNLDAEVELTQILSEQIALEIDREILEDLIVMAKAGTYYWSRSPGKFLLRTTGAEVGASSAAPDFTGNVSEWYETLVETINDVSAQIHRKTLRGGANFVVCGPEVANILEFTAGFRANVTADVDRGTIGAVKVGSLTKKFDVYVDPYFMRNIILVGRKGGSFLESGYVYAPYVPLQVTPTIFGVEDFVPRKGVMTRYAKKMVRPDMYGVVVVQDLLGGAGATS
jgi:hypothetical protein